jgi:FG-GAP repeat protein
MTIDNPGNRFGVAVDIRGNTVVVVAAENPSGAGPVYVFSHQGTTWTQDTKLSPGGHSVSLWGASLVVGNAFASTVSIYEHVGPNWQLLQTLVDSPGTQFGGAVDQRGDSLLIGARSTTVGGTRSGVAYLYGFDEETGQWALNQTLSPADGQNGDLFGLAVSLSGTAAIIGSPRHFHSPNPQSGAAYIYEP